MNTIYLVFLNENKYIITDKLKNIEYIEKFKYKCLECDVLKTRLNTKFKNININGDEFEITKSTLKLMKKHIEKLILDIDTIMKSNTCEPCNFSSYRKENYNKHLISKKHIGNIKNEENIHLKDKINMLEKQITTLTQNYNELNNNVQKINTIFNINHKINIDSFATEKLTKLSDFEICNSIALIDFSIQQLIKTIHFNYKYPEYFNVYVSNIKENNIHVYNGKIWLIDDKTYIVKYMYFHYLKFLKEKFYYYLELKENDNLNSELKEILTDNVINKYTNYLNNTGKYKICIILNLKHTLYNYRKIIINCIK